MTNPLDKVRESQERLKQQTYHPPQPYIWGGGEYFYAYGWKETTNSQRQLVTKLYVDGPFATEKEAELRLSELGLDSGDVHKSKSRDLNRAKKEVSALLAHQSKLPVDVATGRKYRK